MALGLAFDPQLVWAIVIAAIFSLGAISLSLYLIVQLLRFYTQPNHQRYIVRIVSIVPIYAVLSLLSLVFYPYQVYFALVRDSYEAYVLYMFFSLCLNYVGGYNQMLGRILTQPEMKLTVPLCFFRVKLNEKFLKMCRRGILQYVLVKPTVSAICIVLHIFHLYDEGEFRLNRGYLYATIINNTSVTVSLYFIVLFWEGTREELRPYKPILKFLSIKIVVFFSFWQSVAIAIAVALELIPDTTNYTHGEIATGIQNFLICIEMFGVGLLHIYAFPFELYRIKAQSQVAFLHQVNMEMGNVIQNVKHTVDQRDVVDDTYDSFVGDTIKVIKKQIDKTDSINADDEFIVPTQKQRRKIEKKELLSEEEPEPVSSPIPKQQLGTMARGGGSPSAIDDYDDDDDDLSATNLKYDDAKLTKTARR